MGQDHVNYADWCTEPPGFGLRTDNTHSYLPNLVEFNDLTRTLVVRKITSAIRIKLALRVPKLAASMILCNPRCPSSDSEDQNVLLPSIYMSNFCEYVSGGGNGLKIEPREKHGFGGSGGMSSYPAQ